MVCNDAYERPGATRPCSGGPPRHPTGWTGNGRPSPSAISAPIDDAQGHAYDVRKNLSVGPDIFRGRVVDVIAYAHCYRVLLERNGGVVLCMAMVPGGLLPVGARSDQLDRSRVRGPTSCGLHPAAYGMILGGFPRR